MKIRYALFTAITALAFFSTATLTSFTGSSSEGKFPKLKDMKEKDKNKDEKKDKKKYRPNKFKKIKKPEDKPFSESKLAHTLLDGLFGLEIGASQKNPFGLRTLNVDYAETENCINCPKIDLIFPRDDLPFKDNSVDFVINANVIDHFYDPIKAIKEWLRVVKPNGYVYMIVPNKDKIKNAQDIPLTTLDELLNRHLFPEPDQKDYSKRYSYWTPQGFIELCNHFKWNVANVQEVDDKNGKGFTVVLQKTN